MKRTTKEDMSEYNLHGILGLALVLGIGPSELAFRRAVLSAGLIDAVDSESSPHTCAYFFLTENDDKRIQEFLNLYDSYPW